MKFKKGDTVKVVQFDNSDGVYLEPQSIIGAVGSIVNVHNKGSIYPYEVLFDDRKIRQLMEAYYVDLFKEDELELV